MKLCRICLSHRGRLYSMSKCGVAAQFQLLTGMSMDVDKRLPQWVCAECGLRLMSYNKLRQKSLKSHDILCDVLNTCHYTSIEDLNLSPELTEPSLTQSSIFIIEYDPSKEEELGFTSHDESLKSLAIKIEDVDVYLETKQTNEQTDSQNNLDFTADNNQDDFTSNEEDVALSELYKKKKRQKFQEKTINNTKNKNRGKSCQVKLSNNHRQGDSERQQIKKNVSRKSENITDIHWKGNVETKWGEKIICFTHRYTSENTDDEQPLSTKKAPKNKQVRKQKTKHANTKTNMESDVTIVNDDITNCRDKRADKSKDKTNEDRTNDLLKHFTLSLLNDIEQKHEFEKRQQDKFYLDKKHKCLLCYRSFVTQDTYDRHVLFQHTETPDRPYKCPICSTYFLRKSYLNKHVLTHSELYKCKQCDFTTDKRSSAELHVLWHEGKEYECKQCFKTFKHRSTLYNHNRVEHAADCVCALCGYSFTNEWGLKFHLKRIHRENDPHFKAPDNGPLCEECNIRFVSEEALETHRRVSPKHATGSNRLRNDPSASYAKRASLPKVSERDAPRTDVIDPNNALRRQKGQMRNQCVQCEKCDEMHPTFFAYKRHFRTAHPGENRTQFPRLSKQLLCDHCGKVFRSKAYLIDHMNKHTKLAIRCTDCNKSFYSRYAYALHRHTHLGVKYPCKLCGKTFTRQANRARHVVTVHNVRSLKCDFCDKYFKSEEVKKIHIVHVHYNKPWPKRVRNRDGLRGRCDSD